jgi:hypothetical protein
MSANSGEKPMRVLRQLAIREPDDGHPAVEWPLR